MSDVHDLFALGGECYEKQSIGKHTAIRPESLVR